MVFPGCGGVGLVAEFAGFASDPRLSSLGTRASPSAIPSLRSAPLIDIACGDSSLQSSGDISLRSAAIPRLLLNIGIPLTLHLRGATIGTAALEAKRGGSGERTARVPQKASTVSLTQRLRLSAAFLRASARISSDSSAAVVSSASSHPTTTVS